VWLYAFGSVKAARPPTKLVEGMKVRYLPQPEWGTGHLLRLDDGGLRAQVLFPGREGNATLVSTKGGALVPQRLLSGDAVRTSKGARATIVGEVQGARGLRRYVLRFEDGTEDEWPESEIHLPPPKPDALTMLREGRVGDARNFLLRRQALMLDDERRCDALGALFASRIMIKPHQVGVVQRVLSAPRPRFILADEVGLGKTIETGMIFSALRLAGLVKRVLVVAPSHLTVQWLVELFHKFNQLFTFLDAERFALSIKEEPERSPWARFDHLITSLEMLSRSDAHREQASSPEAYWDLVIFDEAHHLKAEKAFELAKSLAGNCWGLLLLTATPMQLDPEEYHRLLTLIEPESAPSLADFEARLRRQEELSFAVRGLLEGRQVSEAVRALAEQFPADERLRSLEDREAVIGHLAETYSLSEALIRNRRVVVGGFSERRLHRHRFEVPEAELAARSAALEMVRASSQLRGAALSNLIRRLESSPAALNEALADTKVKLPTRDSKFSAFLHLLHEIWRDEPSAKILVFTEARATLDMLVKELRKEAIEALSYHGDLPLIERDRQVARFRDPEGPKFLVCTEVGGEGRNFQFAHHLVNYDLPWSPAAMEQRIGRLDRIGQTMPVEIHVFEPRGTFSAELVGLFADSIGVFGETIGGLDAVLEEVETKLAELALASPQEREAYASELKARVAAARAAIRYAYDPLLDLRSFDRDEVKALVARGSQRLGIEIEREGNLEDGLWSLARELDERLEETVTDLARKVGIGVDIDEQVDAFQCAFHLGRELTVEALPGLSLAEDKVVLGTFWRDTAIEREEIDYFASGHPIVEALLGFLRDGPFGRNGMRYIEKRGVTPSRGLEFLFHIVPPEPDDTSPGARVPSRQLARFLDRWLIHLAVARTPQGPPRLDPSLLPILESEGRSLRGDEVFSAFPELASFVDQAAAVALEAAKQRTGQLSKDIRAAIDAEREANQKRLALALAHQGLSQRVVESRLSIHRAYYRGLLEALDGLRVNLDSAAGFVINR
jgi:ATP-dependent helicase HepA